MDNQSEKVYHLFQGTAGDSGALIYSIPHVALVSLFVPLLSCLLLALRHISDLQGQCPQQEANQGPDSLAPENIPAYSDWD